MEHLPELETPSQDRPAFAVTDEGSLSWYVNHLMRLEDEKARIQAQAAAMVADLEREAERLCHLYEDQARAVVRGLLAGRRQGARSVKLLTGTVGFRTVPARLEVRDRVNALDWVEAVAPECLEQRIDQVALGHRYKVHGAEVVDTSTGEVVAPLGFVPRPAEERFYIRAARGASAED